MTLKDSFVAQVFCHQNIPIRNQQTQKVDLEWINSTRNQWKNNVSLLVQTEYQRVENSLTQRASITNTRQRLLVQKQFRKFRNKSTNFSPIDYLNISDPEYEDHIQRYAKPELQIFSIQKNLIQKVKK